MEQLTLRWHGHACFTLTCQDFTVVFDPYEDNYVPGFPPLHLSADLVLCSHQHNDHNAAGIVSLRTGHDNPFHITEIPTFHDPEGGKLRGTNTIHLLEVGKLRVAHFGDLGCPLTPLQRADVLHLDVAMVPVGGYYTIGPEEAKALIDDLQPKVVIPMHYRSDAFGFDVLAPVEDVLGLDSHWMLYETDTLESHENMRHSGAVLSDGG